MTSPTAPPRVPGRSPGLAAALCLLASCASPDGVAGNRAAVFNGTLEAGRLWAVAVVNFDRGSGGGLCTGSLIAPDIVLTAKHCVWHALDSTNYAETDLSRLEVRVGSHAVDDIQQSFGVTASVSTPGIYTRDRIWDGDDVALLRLDGAVVGVSPAQLSSTPPSVDARATLIGYGVHDDGFTVGPKYTGETQIVEVGDWLLRTLGSSWTCQGDSGGPVLVDGRIVGVTSAGRGGCVRDAQHYYTLVSPHLALFRSFLGADFCAAVPDSCSVDAGMDDAGTPSADASLEAGSDADTRPAADAGSPPTRGSGGCALSRGGAGSPGLLPVLMLWTLLMRRRRARG